MEFLEAKCPVCAKSIHIPSDLEKPYCAYCGAQFLKDAALAYAGAVIAPASETPSDPSDFVIIGGTLVDYRGSSTDVKIPEGVTCIGENAFRGNKEITTVSMPDTVTSIGASAFRDCTSLTEVQFSETLVSVESYAFYKCSSLKEAKLPRTTKSIGKWCFEYCASMIAAYYPSGVSLGDYCFNNNPAKRLNI